MSTMKTAVRGLAALMTAAALLVLTPGCRQQPEMEASGPALQAGERYFPTAVNQAGMSASLAVDIQTLDQLKAFSEHIVVGEVLASDRSFSAGYEPSCAYAELRITQVVKGNLSVDQMITISETGIRYADGTDHSIDGVPLLRRGMKVALCLLPECTLRDGRQGFGIQGIYLGKFFYDAGENLHPSSLLGTEHALKLKDCQEVLSEQDLLERLRA